MLKNKTISTKEIKPYAYTITDNSFGELNIKNSANAWWLDKGKVDRLIESLKYDASITECLITTGISSDQLKYFREQHPEFYSIEEKLRELPNMMARLTVVNAIPTDSNLAFKYLERKKPEEFGQKNNSPVIVIPISMREVAKEYQPDVITIQELHREELSNRRT